jgi:hypothetical protein
MKDLTIILLISASLLLAACGKDDAGQSEKAAAPAATPAASKAPMADAAPAAPMAAVEGATRYIDHAKDEIEFGLKKSIAGLESLLEDVSDSEQVAMIKKDIAELKSKLSEL